MQKKTPEMLFHASAAARSGFESVIISSSDTDLLIFLVHAFLRLTLVVKFYNAFLRAGVFIRPIA